MKERMMLYEEANVTLGELFRICYPNQKVDVTVLFGESYEGVVAKCPAHMLNYKVCMARTSNDDLIVMARKVPAKTMTWEQVANAIGTMPKWAREMPAMVHIDPCKKYTGDESYGICSMATYYSDEPGEIKDDGSDFVFMDIDAPLNY